MKKQTLRSSNPVEYYANIPLNSREYYLWDIRSMLERIYPDNTTRFKAYSRIYDYPDEKLVEIHWALFKSLLLDELFDESILFLDPNKKGIGGKKKCSTF